MSITNGGNYVGPSTTDPAGVTGFLGAGSTWLQTDTYNLYVRDVLNASWVLIGITNTQNLGLVPKSGASLTGALTGATGLMGVDGNTPFSAAPVVTGQNSSNLATLNDLANLQSNIYGLVTTTVQQAMASLPTAGISANMAFSQGIHICTDVGAPTSTSTFDIPRPVYSDGTTAPISDCIGKYIAAISAFQTVSSSSTTGSSSYVLSETAPNTMSYTLVFTTDTGVTLAPGSRASIAYMAVAIKPGA